MTKSEIHKELHDGRNPKEWFVINTSNEEDPLISEDKHKVISQEVVEDTHGVIEE